MWGCTCAAAIGPIVGCTFLGCSAAAQHARRRPLQIPPLGPGVPLPDMAAIMRPMQEATDSMVVAANNNRAAQDKLQAALNVARITIPARKIPYNDGTLLIIFKNGTQVELLPDGSLQQQLPNGTFVNVTRKHDAVRLTQLKQYLFNFPSFTPAPLPQPAPVPSIKPSSSGRRLLSSLDPPTTSRDHSEQWLVINI